MEFNDEASFVAKFPDPVTIGTTVTVVGKINSDKRFDFNFLCLPSGDKALQCIFLTHEKRVVRTYGTQTPSFLGREQIEGEWTIKESGEFEAAFRMQAEHIEIYVNRKWFVNFPHLLPYTKITHINGSVGADYTFIKFEKTTKSLVKT